MTFFNILLLFSLVVKVMSMNTDFSLSSELVTS